MGTARTCCPLGALRLLFPSLRHLRAARGHAGAAEASHLGRSGVIPKQRGETAFFFFFSFLEHWILFYFCYENHITNFPWNLLQASAPSVFWPRCPLLVLNPSPSGGKFLELMPVVFFFFFNRIAVSACGFQTNILDFTFCLRVDRILRVCGQQTAIWQGCSTSPLSEMALCVFFFL